MRTPHRIHSIPKVRTYSKKTPRRAIATGISADLLFRKPFLFIQSGNLSIGLFLISKVTAVILEAPVTAVNIILVPPDDRLSVALVLRDCTSANRRLKQCELLHRTTWVENPIGYFSQALSLLPSNTHPHPNPQSSR